MTSTIRIALMPGDRIGPEVMAATVTMPERLAQRHALGLVTETLTAGAFAYRDTGSAMSEDTFRRAETADAILLGAMRWPGIRYPDGIELSPQLDLRFRLALCAGVRPIRVIPRVPGALADPHAAGVDFVPLCEGTAHGGAVLVVRPRHGGSGRRARDPGDHARDDRAAFPIRFPPGGRACGTSGPAGAGDPGGQDQRVSPTIKA